MKKFKKKSVALFATMMVAVAAAGYAYQQNQTEEVLLSELAMANVEALATYEDPNDGDGMKKENCLRDGRVVGQKCVQGWYGDKCHYTNDQWGNCD